MDEPDDGPSIVITTTYPAYATPQEILSGVGAEVGIIGTSIPPFAVITAALRAAEVSMGEHVRKELQDRRGPLTPEPAEIDTLIALNARLALINLVVEMENVPSSAVSFSIDE